MNMNMKVGPTHAGGGGGKAQTQAGCCCEGLTVQDLREELQKFHEPLLEDFGKKLSAAMHGMKEYVDGDTGEYIDGEMGEYVDGDTGEYVDGEMGEYVDGEMGMVVSTLHVVSRRSRPASAELVVLRLPKTS